MANINEMLSQINRLGGLATSNRFAVTITPPAALNTKSEFLTFLCDTVTTPAMSLNGDIYKHKGYGLEEKRVNHFAFEDIQATYMVDNKGIMLGFFDRWMQLAFSYDPNHSHSNIYGDLSGESYNYPEEYYGIIDIAVKSRTGEDVVVYTCDHAFPIAKGGLTLGWEQNDTLARIAVTFTFRGMSTSVTSQTASINNTGLETSTNLRNVSLLAALQSEPSDVVSRLVATV